MKRLVAAIFIVMLIGGCNKGANSHNGKTAEADEKTLPGYQETKLICTQCHALPNPDQFHPAAWPSIVARMEGHIKANNKTMPSGKELEAILGYLQSSASWK